MYRKNLYIKLLRMLIENVELARTSRENSSLHKLMTKCKSRSELHLQLLSKVDFWSIFPVEGKFVMAKEFHEKRLQALCLI